MCFGRFYHYNNLFGENTSEKKQFILDKNTNQHTFKMIYSLLNILLLPVFCQAALEYKTCSPTEDLYLKKLPRRKYLTWEEPITINSVNSYGECVSNCFKEKCNFAIYQSDVTRCILRKNSRFHPATRFIKSSTTTTLERTLCSEPVPGKRMQKRPYHKSTSCHQVKAAGGIESGVYEVSSKDNIYLNQDNAVREFRYLLCDMAESDGGWTVIQKNRKGSQVNFNVGTGQYEKGFGDLRESFWAGNQLIHELTRDKDMELLIILEQQNGTLTRALFNEFHIGNKTDQYRLRVAGYSATKSTLTSSFTSNNGNVFGDEVCAGFISSRWWSSQHQYTNAVQCSIINLNGDANIPCNANATHKGIVWFPNCFKGSTMMIRKRTVF